MTFLKLKHYCLKFMLLCFQVNVLTHCTDVRLSDWPCEEIRETNQRSASGRPDQTIEPVINTIDCPDKEQKSNEVYISLSVGTYVFIIIIDFVI